jgi:hypothetical protein
MTDRLKAILITAACLVCCIPLIVGVLGATTGISAAVGLWFRRYDIAILALIGLVAVIATTARERRSKLQKRGDRA